MTFEKTFMTGTKSQTVISILCFNYSMESNPHSTAIPIISAQGIFVKSTRKLKTRSLVGFYLGFTIVKYIIDIIKIKRTFCMSIKLEQLW